MAEQRPGDAGVLVGQRHGCHLGWLDGDQTGKPWISRTTPFGMANDRHGAGDQQPSQVLIPLLGDMPQALLATG